MLTFDEARQIASRALGIETESWGWGDEKFFYVVLALPEGEFLNDGEPGGCSVNRKTHEVEWVDSDPISMERIWNAPETYGTLLDD
ncbi:hypothetical protein [Schaalia sp. ZJ1691]|uniref:hypothetical protein n=1 Tax=Schaalia sp. ZJ1691 TaxID=2709404 RepID=UPI0013ED56C3|nr:hypothetical protein [Schaalia sp. ZJ1691]